MRTFRVSPMWPGFDSQTCRRVSVDFLIDLHFRGFFLQVHWLFFLSMRNITLNSNSAYSSLHRVSLKYQPIAFTSPARNILRVKIYFLSLCHHSDCSKKKHRSTWWVDNSPHTVRKYTRIFFRGHYEIQKAKNLTRAKLEENWRLHFTWCASTSRARAKYINGSKIMSLCLSQFLCLTV